MTLVLGCLLAFVFGGVPWALVVVRVCKGIDVRTVGSGNVGATNASRAFKTRAGRLLAFVAIYLLDAAKGFLPVLFGPDWVGLDSTLLTAVLLAAAAILGHIFSPFLNFRGGKGVATATGALFVLDPWAVVIAIAVFFVVRLVTGQVFLGSLALGVALAAAAILLHLANAFGERLPVTVLCCLLGALLFWTHRSNLAKHFAKQAGSKRAASKP